MKRYLLFITYSFFFTSSVFAQEGIPLKGESLFGSIRARQIGPAVMSGRVSDLEGVNKDPKILYVGTANGGVWRSKNGGTTFEPIFEKYTQSIGAIAVDQSHPDTIWVGTGETWVRNSVSVGTGIYKTTDGGRNWQFKGLPESERIGKILIDPKSPNTLYVAVQGQLWNAHPDRGLYKTTDGGETWNKILFVNENTGCADISIDSKNSNTIYATMWEHRRSPDFFNSGGKGSGVYKSTDGGKTWNKIQNGIPNVDLGRMAIESAPSKPEVLYLSVEAKDKDHKGLYRSEDGGANWKKVNGDFGISVRPFYFARIVVDPKNENLIYKMGLSLIVSDDGGQKFRSVGSGVHSDMHDVWVNPQNTEIVYLATDGGVYRSMDKAIYFEHLKNLPVSQFYHVSVDNAVPYNVYGGLQDNGSWVGPSRSANGVENRDWLNVGGGDGFWVFPHPTDKDVIFCEYQGGNLLRYSRKTEQTKDIKPYSQKGDPKYRFNWSTPIHLSRNNPMRMYYGAQFLFVSEDMGESWKKISPDLTTNDPNKQRQDQSGGLSVDNSSAENHCTIYSISESTKDENILWVGTDDGNLQVSKDGGKTWTNVAANVMGLPKNTWVSHVEPSNFESNTCYVTFDGHRHGDKKTYIYKTNDLGKTWTNITTADLKGYAHVVKEDLKNPALLFTGTEFGLFITVDGGLNWSQFTNNMPPVAVMDMAIHPAYDDLVMATHGRGIIVIDDITPLRQINKDMVAKDVHFFEMKPVVFGNPTGFQDFAGAGEFVGQNPSENAQITYYLKKRHTFGDMFLEIFDDAGTLIKKLPAGKSAGINRVEWATRLRPPKTAVGETFTFGNFVGPTVPEGKYTVKMTKGKETYTSYLTLTGNPSLPYSTEERKLQQQTALKLYEMTEQLAHLAGEIQSAKKQADEKAKLSKKNAKALMALSQELEAMNKKLVITSGDNYVASAEPQLREKISEIYGAVAGFAGKPANSHLERMRELEKDLKDAGQKFEDLKIKKINPINEALKKETIAEFKFKTWEEFKKQEG